MILKKQELLDVVIQSIYRCGWNALFIDKARQHPLRIRLFKGNDSIQARVYIWNLTHGGGSARPENEFRIQITGTTHFELDPGSVTLILGYREQDDIFAGFDYIRHSKPKLGASPSFQIREEFLQQAHQHGISFCPKGNNEVAVAFKPEFIVEYIKNIKNIHNFMTKESDFVDLQKAVSDRPSFEKERTLVIDEPRKKVIVALQQSIRDSGFRERVLSAYTHRCAFCGIQLDLVEAAHILPVSCQYSSDETSNGITLCALHHRAYDRSFVTFDENYRIVLSDKKAHRLRDIGHDEGLSQFKEALKTWIFLPANKDDRPKAKYINEANAFRGWN